MHWRGDFQDAASHCSGLFFMRARLFRPARSGRSKFRRRKIQRRNFIHFNQCAGITIRIESGLVFFRRAVCIPIGGCAPKPFIFR